MSEKSKQIGFRIRSRREQLEMNQSDLAKIAGVNKSTIQRYESGEIERIKLPVIQALAERMGVNPEWLILKTDQMQNEPSNIVLLDQSKVRMLPTYESVSAGFGALASSQIVTYTPVFIQCDAEAVDSLCINVKGNSMYPKIEDGDLVVVRKQSSVDNGQIAVVLIDGDEGLVKKVYYGNGWIELVSINPEYAPKRFEGSEAKRVEVVGLVRKIIKNCE